MFSSTYLQVYLILYLGISFVDSQTSFYSHLLVFERTANDQQLVAKYFCLGTSIHYLWAVVHDNCLNKTGLPKLGYEVAPTMFPEIYDEFYYVNTYLVRELYRSSVLNKDFNGLILLRLQSPIQTIQEIQIGIVPTKKLSTPTICKMLTWNIRPNPSYNTTGLEPVVRQVMARPISVGNSKNYSISVYTNRSLCKSVPGSLLSCNNIIQAVAGILVDKSCFGRNKHISFVDIGGFRQLFRDEIEDFEWVQSQRSKKTDKASCLGTVGYVWLGFILIVHKHVTHNILLVIFKL